MAFYLFERPGKKKEPTNSAPAVRSIAARNPKNTPQAINAFFGPG